MSKLSIIIATYNSAATLSCALESVLCQNFKDWECIIVDGFSTDNTIGIVKQYCECDARFRYISEKDSGIYDAFNKGWKMAKGEWIYYLGSDDRLTKNGMLELMETPDNSDIIGGGVYLCRDGEKPKAQYTKGIGGCHQGFITKRSVIEELGGFDMQYKIFADKDLLIRLGNAGYKIDNYPILIAHFYIGGISQNIKSLYTLTRERYKSYKNTGYTKHPLASSINSYIHALLVFFNHKVL